MTHRWSSLAAVAAIAFAGAACDINRTDDGVEIEADTLETPDVDVDVSRDSATIPVPNVDVDVDRTDTARADTAR